MINPECELIIVCMAAVIVPAVMVALLIRHIIGGDKDDRRSGRD